MDNKLNKDLLRRYLLGLSGKEDEKHLYETKESKQMLQGRWNAAREKQLSAEKKAAMLSEIRRRTNQRNLYIKMRPFLRIAAVLLIGIIFTAVLFSDRIFKDDAVKMLSIQSPAGIRSNLNLPDGTKVILAGGSRIKYPENFEGDLREVFLSGRAFFDVVHNAQKPFVVSTPKMDVQVLGTRFSVTAYPSDRIVKTVLVSGSVKVMLNGQDQDVLLKPDEQFIYDSKNKSARLEQVNAGNLTAWIYGKQFFDQDDIFTVCKELEYWYGVDIELENAKNQDNLYTLTIEDNSLEEVLLLLKKVSPMEYDISGNKVRITYKQQN